MVFREFPLIFVLTLAEFTIAMMLAKSKQSKIHFLGGFFAIKLQTSLSDLETSFIDEEKRGE